MPRPTFEVRFIGDEVRPREWAHADYAPAFRIGIRMPLMVWRAVWQWLQAMQEDIPELKEDAP